MIAFLYAMSNVQNFRGDVQELLVVTQKAETYPLISKEELDVFLEKLIKETKKPRKIYGLSLNQAERLISEEVETDILFSYIFSDDKANEKMYDQIEYAQKKIGTVFLEKSKKLSKKTLKIISKEPLDESVDYCDHNMDIFFSIIINLAYFGLFD
jgi:hypothetical protein